MSVKSNVVHLSSQALRTRTPTSSTAGAPSDKVFRSYRREVIVRSSAELTDREWQCGRDCNYIIKWPWKTQITETEWYRYRRQAIQITQITFLSCTHTQLWLLELKGPAMTLKYILWGGSEMREQRSIVFGLTFLKNYNYNRRNILYLILA